MKSPFNKILAASLIAGTVFGTTFAAEGQPAAKSTAMASAINILDNSVQSAEATEPAWTPILSNTIKTANPSDLFVDVSLECGLYTGTTVKSKNGVKDTSTADASVKVRVLVDGVEAHPGAVNFCRRSQELTATFQGLLTDEEGNSCLITEAVVDEETGEITGYTTTIDEECVRPEELGLILQTMNANAFNFIIADVGSGVHNVEVQAMIDSDTTVQEGEASAMATLGKGSVVVEEVKMIQDEDI
jgi:hypothetical protein